MSALRYQTTVCNRGIALVSVLWVVALLTVIASGLSASVRTESRVVGNTVRLLQAQYAAESGIELAALNLMHPQSVRWPPDGSIRELETGTATLRIATWDETGKIDINQAPSALLTQLITQTGETSADAEVLVDAIMDWRDADDFRRLNGAEDSDYRIARLPYGAKNAPFESVGELRFVLGMTDELFASLHPSLTVFSGKSVVNTTYASPQVIAALAGFENMKSASAGTTFKVQVEARVDRTIVSQAEATINITYTGIGRPYSILQWSQPRDRLFPDVQRDLFMELDR